MLASAAGQPELRIVELLRNGRQAEAFQCLMETYETRVFRLCCALLRNCAEAEDAAQESLVHIWRNLASFDGRAALTTWIYAITRNRCLTALERRRQELSLSDEQVALPEGTVKTHLHRPRAQLAQRLQALGLDDARLWLESET